MSKFDHAVVNCWRTVVARGEPDTMSNVRDELVARRIRIVCNDLTRRIAWLRRMEQLP